MPATLISACTECGKRIQVRTTQRAAPVCHKCRRRLGPPNPKCWVPQVLACMTCGEMFKQQRRRQRYCCPEHRRPKRRRETRACEICGKPYQPQYAAQRTCGRACGVELRRREGSIPPKRWPSCMIYVRDCACCGKLFTGRTLKSSWCSQSCYDRTYNLRCRPPRFQPGDWRCQSCDAPVADGRQKCNDCLVLSIRQAKQRKRRAERARMRGIRRESYTLEEIAQRDRFRCGLCRKRVAMTKTVPHPKAPTIDHVVPVACGGDDTRANVQLAHFSCNARKRIGGSQQLAMIG